VTRKASVRAVPSDGSTSSTAKDAKSGRYAATNSDAVTSRT
jgi:hypothetical protein